MYVIRVRNNDCIVAGWVMSQVVKDTEQAAQQVEKEAAKEEGGGAEATAPAVEVEVAAEPEAEGKQEEEKAPVEEGQLSHSSLVCCDVKYPTTFDLSSLPSPLRFEYIYIDMLLLNIT